VWADAVPNLVIGLREGLEIGLVVGILLTTLRRVAPDRSVSPVWLGVLAAAVLSLGFGAVLTFSRAELSLTAQAVFSGALSLVAIVLVTWMIFWMRRTARGLSGELRDKVDQALTVGAGALALTAFLSVAREGLETALFLWTTVQAANETVGPLIGAALGLGAAMVLCWLIMRSSLRLNLGVFFSRTAVLLVVIAAGVLAYGVGELQIAGILPGRTWAAFDLSQVISTDSWWVSMVSGITNLTPKMTWFQIVAYLCYGTVVLAALLRKPGTEAAGPPVARTRARWGRLPRWAYVTAAVVAPLLVVGAFALFTVSQSGRAGRQVTVTATGCATDWTGVPAGQSIITVVNRSNHGGEIYLTRSTDGAVIGEIEGLGPGTRRSIAVDLTPGQYTWRCLVPGELDQVSPAAAVSGDAGEPAVPAVVPVSDKDLAGPAASYTAYIADKLATLAAQADTLRARLDAHDLAGARTAWLPAQLTWERIGAAYDRFGDLGQAIDGRPQGLPGGTADPGFTGLHRIEFGLWHGQDSAQLAPIATKLHADVVTLQHTLPSIETDPADLPLRAHEILEDALRWHLTGLSDQGADAAYAETAADVDATNAVLDRLADLVNDREHDLIPKARSELTALTQILQGNKMDETSLADRQVVDSRLGEVLETLSAIPAMLEVRAS